MMDQPKYRIEIFWSDEDGGYIANVPDLRYCSAFGETYEEALREVLVAMELHLETLREQGRPIPEPTVRRVVGVRADMSDPGGTVQIVEEVAVTSVENADEVAGQLADAASQIVEDVSATADELSEGVTATVDDVAEGAGATVEDVGEGTGYTVEYPDEGSASEQTRPGRRSNR
jgi:predicted RNase H-like HicB family nuclease